MPADFAAIRDFLFALKPHGATYGLDRMRVLARALGHPERRTPCIHVAGTNGKGSVAALLESILRQAGWRVGLYTSPHLVHVGERVQVDRQPLREAEIVAYVEEIAPVAERLGAEDPELAPSFFEWMTAMAFLQFARTACDIAVIETGLGGRLDATNVVTPELGIITSIGLDHCELLGDSLEKIAAEKAGIVKPGVPLILGRMPGNAAAVIRRVAADRGSVVQSVEERFSGRPLPSPSLAGHYQRWNAATAVLAAETLGARWRIDATMIEPGLQTAHWPARWQRVELPDRTLIIDASHNPEGAAALEANLAELVRTSGARPVVIAGVLGVARAGALLDVIGRRAQEVVLVTLPDPRACTAAELRRFLPPGFTGRVGEGAVESLFPGPGRCTAGSPGDIVVVTGSIYLAGAVMERLGLSG